MNKTNLDDLNRDEGLWIANNVLRAQVDAANKEIEVLRNEFAKLTILCAQKADDNVSLRRQLDEARRPWSVSLLSPTPDDPFNRVECRVIDVGHADHVLVVESDSHLEALGMNQAEER